MRKNNMNEVLEILMEINPTIDYSKEKNLIDNKVLDSFSIITLVSEISDHFDIDIGPKWLKPEHFNSVEAIWNMVQILQDEE